MSISIPDDRELKLDVSLSAIYMPEVGQQNGYYSVFNFAPDPQNLRPLNYDNKNNNPKIIFDSAGRFGTPFTQYADFKLGSRVRTLPALQNAHILEVMTHPTASSCTFAFGGIISDTPHVIFNMLKGPSVAEYITYAGYSPNRISTVTNLQSPFLNYDFNDLDNFKPLIPFIKEYASSTQGLVSVPPPYSSIQFSHWLMYRNTNASVYTTYNIWNLVDKNGNFKSKDVKEFEGPVGTTVSGKGNPTIKTIRDGINGSRLYVDSKGKGKTSIIKRVFPISKDVVNTNPKIFFPTKLTDVLFGTEYLVLDAETVNTVSSANSGFHIQLTNLNASSSDSLISIVLEDTTPKDNTSYSLTINLFPNSLPQILVKYKKNGQDFYYEYTQIKGPIFDGKSPVTYDVFVHFVGPVLLVGFVNDQSMWNAIYPEELESTTTIDNPQTVTDKANIEHYFGKETSYIRILSTNANYEMRYSSILFNNFSRPSSVSTNNYESKNEIFTDSYIKTWLVRPTLRRLNTKNQILMSFKAPINKSDKITESSISQQFHDYKYSGVNSPRYTTLPNGTISAMPDWRSALPPNTTTNPTDFVFKKIAYSNNNNPPFSIQQYALTWGNLFFNGTIEGPAFLSLESPAASEYSIVDFLKPITKGNITAWTNKVQVNVNSDLENFSLIRKSANIDLINIDTTPEGLRLLELLEHNVLVVTVRAGYGKVTPQDIYFQGVITNISTSRSGSQSKTTLSCMDLGNYILENLFFDYIVPFGNRTIKTCLQAVMNFSGFSKYYTIRNEQPTVVNNRSIGGIAGLNLRIVNNPAANSDAIRATNLDKIGEKLKVFLSKLFTLEALPTFRWDERSGFVLDARYAEVNHDKDLKFVGYDINTNQTLNMRTLETDPLTGLPYKDPATGQNSNIPDWHGLLNGEFDISVNVNPISASVSTYGFTYIGLVEESTDIEFYENALSTTALNKVVDAINNTANPVPSGYVGFNKKIIDSLSRNELPTKELVQTKHKENKLIASRPIHNLSFSCYVTRPLTAHGTFSIKAFIGSQDQNNLEVTSKYIYQSVNYTIDKSSNLITAYVTGYSHPWTIKDLQVDNGE